ncbi:hypothetical protein B0I33_104516 [Prauserella shujinwangii]|uniref:Uncharacterized protein n=1 Tax=Prauserella shujinwangii TaxID=1453103 RepID=A0A2T0LXF3_9PSEU|nr:hypothetical protein [Prauserella shujinwangii]PRX48698.1 hypothetical protein B0I33_104516 [Prauserella shujinwangii]
MFEKRDPKPGMVWKLTLRGAEKMISHPAPFYARTVAELDWVDGRWDLTIDGYLIEEVPDPIDRA